MPSGQALSQGLRPGVPSEQVSSLEKQLMILNMEKKYIDSQLQKFPPTAGKSIAQRREKAELERKLEDLEKTITGVRKSLRGLQCL